MTNVDVAVGYILLSSLVLGLIFVLIFRPRGTK